LDPHPLKEKNHQNDSDGILKHTHGAQTNMTPRKRSPQEADQVIRSAELAHERVKLKAAIKQTELNFKRTTKETAENLERMRARIEEIGVLLGEVKPN